jgi:hypothetical protein
VSEAQQLDFDISAAAEMLAALHRCEPAKRVDTLAAVMKVFIECEDRRHADV